MMTGCNIYLGRVFKMRKILITLIVILFAASTFSAIGYEHFTVQENQVFTELLVNLSRAFKSAGRQSDWQNEALITSINRVPLRTIIESMIAGYDIDIVVTDKSGTIFYDADATEIGRNTLTNPLYQNFPELLELFEQHIMVEKRGEGSYSFYASGMGVSAEKHVMWNTIDAFGTEIKVCMITK
jgi:hypothetical protein